MLSDLSAAEKVKLTRHGLKLAVSVLQRSNKVAVQLLFAFGY